MEGVEPVEADRAWFPYGKLAEGLLSDWEGYVKCEETDCASGGFGNRSQGCQSRAGGACA